MGLGVMIVHALVSVSWYFSFEHSNGVLMMLYPFEDFEGYSWGWEHTTHSFIFKVYTHNFHFDCLIYLQSCPVELVCMVDVHMRSCTVITPDHFIFTASGSNTARVPSLGRIEKPQMKICEWSRVPAGSSVCSCPICLDAIENRYHKDGLADKLGTVTRRTSQTSVISDCRCLIAARTMIMAMCGGGV